MSVSKILYQTLCVFSQMKDTKHSRLNFHSVTWVMPQGWDFGALGVPRGQKKNFKRGLNMSISKIFIPNFACVLTNKR